MKRVDDTDVENIILALEVFLDRRYDWISKETDVSFDNKFIVFNFGNISKGYKSILLLATLELIKTHFINSMEDRMSNNKVIWLYVEDFGTLVRVDSCIEYLKFLSKITRRYAGILTFVTRDIIDVLQKQNDSCRSILLNCGYIQLLRHASGYSADLSKWLNIPDEYISFIISRPAGEGLIWAEGSYISFSYRYRRNIILS